jgi:BirA family biotin operon repressor/biotin-[acetyl-CoA-carboxylase] ligase
MPDALTRDAVVPRLRGRFGREYLYAERCESTQRLIPRDAPEGTVAVAEEQAEGRGRLGRRWEAVAGTSVLCSVLLRPEVAPERLPELTLVGARACAAAIGELTGLAAELKDPNDVLVGGRKVAGVLGESSEGRVVLGIGINVNIPEAELPRETRLPPTSLLAELGQRVDRAELLVLVLDRLERAYDAWVAT